MTGSVCADFHSCSSISISSSCDTFSYSAIRHYIIKAVRRGGLFGILSKEFHVKRLLLRIFFVPLPAINKKAKKTRIHHQHLNVWERNYRDCGAKIGRFMELTKQFLEKVFSTKRMERYFALYPNDEAKAIRHYECNLMLAESLYVSLSVMEVALRNALCRELETMTGREDWYAIFSTTPELSNLNRYITEAGQHITARCEQITPSKIVAELTLGFWVSLLNAEYERTLWHALRRAFPYMPRRERQRRNVSAPLNTFRRFRNRIFHNESICWNLTRVEEIHAEVLKVIGWMNRDLPEWVEAQERFPAVCADIRKRLEWMK